MPLIDPEEKIAELQSIVEDIQEAQAALESEGATVEPLTQDSEACRLILPAAAERYAFEAAARGYLRPRYANEQEARAALKWFREYLQGLLWHNQTLIVRLS